MTRWREFNNQIFPAIPYIAIYDSGGSQTINGSFLIFDSIKSKTSHFNYIEDDNRVQISSNDSGLYEIFFNISLSGNGIAYFDIYKNGSIIDESRVYCSPLDNGQEEYYDSCSFRYVIFLEKDDYIQIKGSISSGSAISLANTARLMIKALPMHGWDNNKAGRFMYKGGVLR